MGMDLAMRLWRQGYDGHPETGHRCPGERAALGLLTETLRVLAALEPTGPSDVRVDAQRIPTRPTDGLVVRLGTAP